jgi:hypothetical protein
LVCCALAASAAGQTVDELQMLPPLGEAEGTAESTGEAIMEPGQMISDPVVGEVPWWQPSNWFSSPVWDLGAELGVNGTAGNAQAFSILAAINGKRETEGSVLEWDLKYAKTQSDGIETQNFALFNSRSDWKFTTDWLLYNKNFLEYDEFKAFDLRLVLSGGLGYHLIKNERTTLTSRAGAGASREFGGPDDEWIPESNLGGDFEHKLNKRQSLKLQTDYYPAWEDFQDYRLITNAYWEIILDETTNLSLKIGGVDRYDSTPNGAKANDINYFVTLLWKL